MSKLRVDSLRHGATVDITKRQPLTGARAMTTAQRFTLRAYFSDGHSVALAESYGRQFEAERAGSNYIRDYSDPCGLGIRCTSVAVLDAELARAA